MIQGSPEWFAARIGRVTASRVSDVIAKTKSGYAASRANYMAQLVAERLTGMAMETYTNAAMQWGVDQEPMARDAYCFRNDVEVQEVGFVDHPSIKMAGASPDGQIMDDFGVCVGLVEIKCPNTATHIDTLLGEPIDGKYIAQMQFQMACTGAQWCDFVSFDPRMPETMRLHITRVRRDDTRITEIEAEVRNFLAEVDRRVSMLQALRPAA